MILKESAIAGEASMFISSDSEAKFPRCVDYMKHSLDPKIFKVKQPKVYKAFLKACGSASNKADYYLKWGTSPQVNISEDMQLLEHNKERDLCGFNPVTFFNQNGTGSISIAGIRGNALEKCLAAVDIVNNKRRFECTLLHELVHFVRERGGETEKLYTSNPDDPPLEAGEMFERWAYGKLTCDKDNIDDAKSSIF